jgi:GntR family transcriptional repressor for pyruvate dehydrogenase complex
MWRALGPLSRRSLFILRPVSTAPSSDRVSRLIRETIAARSLQPGDRLGTEEDLARELSVSRPAVREAVRLLAGANLVRAARGPGGGVFVARTADHSLAQTVTDAIASMLGTELTSVAELTEARLVLEVPLAGLAAKRASVDTIAQLRRAVEDATHHADDDAVQREADARFHWTIAQAAGNPVACALIAWSHELLQPRLKDLIKPALVEAVARQQHREIIAAIELRTPALAESAMRDHLRYLSDLLDTVTPTAEG